MTDRTRIMKRALLLALGVVAISPVARPQGAQIFDDVPSTAPYFRAVNTMWSQGITNGCSISPRLFCPDPTFPNASSTGYLYRYQMAAFVVRAWSIRLYGSAEAFKTYAPPSNVPYFADVTSTANTSVPVNDQWSNYVSANTANAFPYIQKMWELGFTSGCVAGNNNTTRKYCPGDLPAPWDSAWRASDRDISVFSVRARLASDNACTVNCGVYDGFSYSTSQHFTDVPPTDPDFKWVQKVYDYGAVQPSQGMLGCSAYNYCLTNSSYRGQMANFVVGIILGQPI